MSYRRLVSSAPASSLLNTQFHYTRSADTDLRKTFARLRRDAARTRPIDTGTNVRPLARSPRAAAPALEEGRRLQACA